MTPTQGFLLKDTASLWFRGAWVVWGFFPVVWQPFPKARIPKDVNRVQPKVVPKDCKEPYRHREAPIHNSNIWSQSRMSVMKKAVLTAQSCDDLLKHSKEITGYVCIALHPNTWMCPNRRKHFATLWKSAQTGSQRQPSLTEFYTTCGTAQTSSERVTMMMSFKKAPSLDQ